MEELLKRRKYLGIFLDCHTPPEDSQHFSQGPPGEADSDICTPKLCSAHGQSNDPAPREAKTRTTIRMRWEARQVRLQKRRNKEEATRRDPSQYGSKS